MSPEHLSLREYYRLPTVRQRIREYCGASRDSALTCVYLSALTSSVTPYPSWDNAPAYPPDALDGLLDEGADISRSLLDSQNLLLHLDLDYLNADHPDEPFTHPAEVFFKLEAVYRATQEILRTLELPLLPLMTGGGYHFTGRIGVTTPTVDRLAHLVVTTPSWLATRHVRRAPWTSQELNLRLARAHTGVGLLVEYLAHLIYARSAPVCRIPVVLNGTVVGTGITGRECVSIDFSYAGDPLDVRQIRVAFGAYQKHHFWPDVIGAQVARQIPPLVAIPRQSEGLFEMLERGRDTTHAAQAAAVLSAEIPDVSRGLWNLLEQYITSSLAAFHRDFYAVAPHPPSAWPKTYDRLSLDSLLPCVAAPLATPNDLLLQPTRLQHLTRGLRSNGWHPRHIAGLVHSRYARDFEWGSRWVAQMDAQMRAEFDVRVFAGLIATGLDRCIDFNCVSAQEKGLCPLVGCKGDLRQDRDRLLGSVAS